jgi:hypothetical protein
LGICIIMGFYFTRINIRYFLPVSKKTGWDGVPLLLKTGWKPVVRLVPIGTIKYCSVVPIAIGINPMVWNVAGDEFRRNGVYNQF